MAVHNIQLSIDLEIFAPKEKSQMEKNSLLQVRRQKRGSQKRAGIKENASFQVYLNFRPSKLITFAFRNLRFLFNYSTHTQLTQILKCSGENCLNAL